MREKLYHALTDCMKGCSVHRIFLFGFSDAVLVWHDSLASLTGKDWFCHWKTITVKCSCPVFAVKSMSIVTCYFSLLNREIFQWK